MLTRSWTTYCADEEEDESDEEPSHQYGVRFASLDSEQYECESKTTKGESVSSQKWDGVSRGQ